MIPLVVGVGRLLVVGIGEVPSVTVGRLTVGVRRVGRGAAVVGVAIRGMGEGMRIRVGIGVGAPSKEIEQPARERLTRPTSRLKRMRFISSSSPFEGLIPLMEL
jgi:hypothetical protein